MEGFNAENSTFSSYALTTDTNYLFSLPGTLPQQYLCLQRYFMHTVTVEPAEVFDLKCRLDNQANQNFMNQLEVRLRLAALLYRQGQRSEARSSLRSMVLSPNSCCPSLKAKVWVALVLAAAGDVQTALEVIHHVKNTAKEYAVRKEVEQILPFFEKLAYKFKAVSPKVVFS